MIQGELQRRLSSGGGEGRGRASLSSSRTGGRGAQRTIKILVADDDRDTFVRGGDVGAPDQRCERRGARANPGPRRDEQAPPAARRLV